MFSCEFCEIFKNTYFQEHLRATASEKVGYENIGIYDEWNIWHYFFFSSKIILKIKEILWDFTQFLNFTMDHSFSTYAKFSKKLQFLTSWTQMYALA